VIFIRCSRPASAPINLWAVFLATQTTSMEGHTPNEASNGAPTGEQGVRAHCLRKIPIGILPFHSSLCACLPFGFVTNWFWLGGKEVIPLYNKFLVN
jgi:hypothetical protein